MILPALADTTKDPSFYINDNKWAIQQKVDGQRVIAHINEHKLKCYSRSGQERNIPQSLTKKLESINGNWVFDGELVGKDLWVFDILDTPKGPAASLPWADRQRILSIIFRRKIPGLNLLPSYFTTEEKLAFYERMIASHAEGVMFKNVEMPYPKGRSGSFIKYKFIKTVDCIVVGTENNNKQNYVLAVYDDSGNLQEVGKVSALSGDKDRIQIGDVVEVKILYVTNSNKLYQPVSPKIRLDKMSSECTIAQLEELKTSKKVHSF